MPLESLDLSDIGNATLFAAQHQKHLRYYVARGVWLVWNGKHWEDDDSKEVARRGVLTCDVLRRMALDLPLSDEIDAKGKRVENRESRDRAAALAWALASRSKERRAAMIEGATAHQAFVVRPKDLDSDPYLLNTPNGVVDLRDRTRKPHTGETRALLMTRMCGAEYHPEAESEAWKGFLATLTGGDSDLESYLQRTLGYAIFGAWREKQFWFAYGPPDGGKSTLLSIVGKVLGTYAMSADQATWMQHTSVGGNRGDLVRLAGARLVTTSEITPGVKFDPALMKKVTGGDPITAAAKFEGDVEFRPSFALWLAGNDRPMISATDDGMYRRLRCVPFTHQVPEEKQDRELVEKIVEGHGSAVLRWLVDGWSLWREKGIGTCDAVARASKEYRESMNPLLDFAEEKLKITLDKDHAIEAGLLFEEYQQWCVNTRQKFVCGKKTFNSSLKALGATYDDTDHKKRLWRGLVFQAR